MCNFLTLDSEEGGILLKVKITQCKPNKLSSVNELFHMLESAQDKNKLEDSWIFVSPGVIEIMCAECGTISSKGGIYKYYFGGKSISIKLGIGRIPTIKRWTQISCVYSRKLKYTLSESCKSLIFFEIQ